MLLCKSTQPRKQTMIIVMRQPGAINISGQIKLCSDPFNRRSLYKLPVMLPLGCRAASCLMMQTADVFSEGRGGRMRSLALFSKKSVYRMCLFSLTELELPEIQSICISRLWSCQNVFVSLISDSAWMMMMVYTTVTPCCLLYSREKNCPRRPHKGTQDSQTPNNPWYLFPVVSKTTSRMHLVYRF